MIAFTSNVLAQMKFQSSVDENLGRFLNYSLAFAPANTTDEPCRYWGYADEEGRYSKFGLELIIAKLTFCLVFEVRNSFFFDMTMA